MGYVGSTLILSDFTVCKNECVEKNALRASERETMDANGGKNQCFVVTSNYY